MANEVTKELDGEVVKERQETPKPHHPVCDLFNKMFFKDGF